MTKNAKRAKKQQLIELLQFYSQDINRNGFHYNIKKITNALGITDRTLRRYIQELKEEKIIEKTGNYVTKKHSSRVRFLTAPPSISRETILSLEKAANRNANETEIENPSYKNLLNEIDTLVNKNNEWSPVRIFNTCRYAQWETGKKRVRKHEDFKGRVYSNLSFTKSMKKGKEYKTTDCRISREKMLEMLGLENYMEIYDICSEIPRLTAVYNGIHAFNEIEDYYNFLALKARVSITREAAKSIFMRCYFEKSEKAAWRNFANSADYKKHAITRGDFLAFFEATKSELKPLGNFVFILTSYIEQAVLNEFKGYKPLNVYDGFYSGFRLGGKIKKFLAEKCSKLFSRFGGIDKDQYTQNQYTLDQNNSDQHPSESLAENIINIREYTICGQNSKGDDNGGEKALKGGEILTCGQNFQVDDNKGAAKETLTCGQNSKGEDNLRGGLFSDGYNVEEDAPKPISPIKRLEMVIEENERKYDLSKGLSYKEYTCLPKSEKGLYISVRSRSGAVLIKKPA
jgi:DNA-binding Lrp family transcriptional regulator